jgi:hypothetical protein
MRWLNRFSDDKNSSFTLLLYCAPPRAHPGGAIFFPAQAKSARLARRLLQLQKLRQQEAGSANILLASAMLDYCRSFQNAETIES